MSFILPCIHDLQQQLESGATTAVALTKQALERINDPNGEGSATFISVYADQALAAAHVSDELRAAGLVRSKLDGIPISIKDLFDYKGDTTRGASMVLQEAPAANENATLVDRLLLAGAIIIGRTTMTEFAFSGLGINPNYGTPLAPWDRAQGRIPGGSSSGAGVSVADGMAVAAIGTDTGGSIRIPAAFCGLTGFKPTAARIPTQGVMPLSHSLDSSGPLAASVASCATVDAILSAQPEPMLQQLEPNQLRFLLPTNYALKHMQPKVQVDFERAVNHLRQAGVQIIEAELPLLDQLPYINRKGGLVCAEAWYHHQNHMRHAADAYDPRVAQRILLGKDQSAADYIELLQARQQWIAQMEQQLAPYNCLIMPTTPLVPPTLAELEDEEKYFLLNGLILRNPAIINFLNGCAYSLPCHEAGTAPVGLMLGAPAYTDAALTQVAYTVEQLLKTTHY